uniref:Uncharacterized protein n=1 Tax=Candidatus Kentrum sp. SD TaxID=2126332 RepID=A0A450YMS9_9GAMM|nr:MAG: hypothetical protein BECKSD772F_GA0070984_102118 [Candidatus Kentron sp. SD]VFK42847.1 MAG: hypothetical protein BECKSD772E_GA0070983_102018 [Candidatus Kentron sp. SD]VFK78658.1 MAG: hypothetical protein BECKSD772D_GA0070982_102111 [Candidatus Kentron sp. SD]
MGRDKERLLGIGTNVRIRFHSEAEFELCVAREWYAHQRHGLDAEFMRCMQL